MVHFYHLHALDWVDVGVRTEGRSGQDLATGAIDFGLAEERARTISSAVQDRVRTLVESGQLSLFRTGYWGHPAYRLPPEANLLAVAHYLEALEFQRDFIRIHAVLGGKNPHLQTFLVGGMATAMDPDEPHGACKSGAYRFSAQVAKSAQRFRKQVYIPDVLAVAGFYPRLVHARRRARQFPGLRRVSPKRSIRDFSSVLPPARHRPGIATSPRWTPGSRKR